MNHASHSLRYYLNDYLERMKTLNYSEQTSKLRKFELEFFFDWCEERSLVEVDQITRPVVEKFQHSLARYRQKSGKCLSIGVQRSRLSSIRQFFKYLARNYYIENNPASELQMPKDGQRLPRDILSASEMEQILIQPDINTADGLRDRAIIEVFYSCAIRRAELLRLDLYDIDFDRGVLHVREGKGGKDRVVPIGERALIWVEKYLYESRVVFALRGHSERLFINNRGKDLDSTYLTLRIRKYVEAADIRKKGSCHMFRHTTATLMLENGADIRFIQQMLGHAKLDTTQVYTRVSIDQLRKVHKLTHPADQKQRNAESTEKEDCQKSEQHDAAPKKINPSQKSEK